MSCSFSRAAFQYGIKMSEGRKTRRFKETNDKAELDRQWKKISAVSARAGLGLLSRELPAWPRTAPTQCCPRCPSHGSSVQPRAACACVGSRAGSLPTGFAPCKSISQVFGASVLQRNLELRFGTVDLGAAPVRGFLLWAVQQMKMPQTISSEPSKGDWRGQDMFSGSVCQLAELGLSWQSEQCGMGWGR